MKKLARLALILAILLLSSLTACGIIPDIGSSQQPTPEDSTPLPNPLTPTPALASFHQQAGKPCRLAHLKSISTSSEQGSLVAWSPDGKKIAYVSPTVSHSMFSGSLVIASAPDYQPSAPIGAEVTGGLFWSPSGERIAFTAMRPSDSVYTIFVTNLNGNVQTDLFPGGQAHIDPYASPKIVVGWPVEDRMRVQVACGDGCVKILDVSVPGGQKSELPSADPTRVVENWISPRNVISYDEKMYPVMSDPNWSNDGNYATYFDQDGFLWVLSLKDSSAVQVEMEGEVLPVYLSETWNHETKWSSGGLLAVRISGTLEIFSAACRK